MENKKIRIFKNSSTEGPGILESLLVNRNLRYTITDLQESVSFPSNLEDTAAVVILGGPDSANDKTDKIIKELVFIDSVLRRSIPYLGICLGLQLMVKAGGGRVVKNPIKETGFRDPENNFFLVNLTSVGISDPLFTDLGNEFRVFHLHGETVEPAPVMSLLATGKFCRNQVVKSGDCAYGIQSHFELTPAMFEDWITIDPDLLKLESGDLRRDFLLMQKEYTETGNILFNNFLKIAGF